MAQNVLLKYGNTSTISGEAIQQGKILIDTEKAEISIDKDGTTRLPLTPITDSALSTTSTNPIANNAITNSIVNTSAEVLAITEDYIPCGTKPVKELNNNLSNLNEKALRLLWVNPNMSTTGAYNFTPQDIDLLDSDYDALRIYFHITKAGGTAKLEAKSVDVLKGFNVCLNASVYTGSGILALWRELAYVNDTKYSATAERQGNTQTDNNNMVPLYIYGYKF